VVLCKFYPILKEDSPCNCCRKRKQWKHHFFYEANISLMPNPEKGNTRKPQANTLYEYRQKSSSKY
jgi:hypothetical protein